MTLFDTTARRLQRGPAVLFPYDPGTDRLLSTVQQSDPAARQRRNTIHVEGIQLLGPIPITPDLAFRTQVPSGMICAYLAKAKGTQAQFAASLLTSGLAARLGGTA